MGMTLSVYEDNGKIIKEYDLDSFNKDAIGFGRETDCDIQMKSSYVSRLHGCIYKESDGWHIKDLDSSFGLYYNGKKIQDQKVSGGEHFKITNNDGKYSELVFRGQMDMGVQSYQPQQNPANYPQQQYVYNYYGTQPANTLGMKWFNFIIWFQLFVIAIYCLYAAYLGFALAEMASEANIRYSYNEAFGEYGDDFYEFGRDSGINDYVMQESGMNELKAIGIIVVIIGVLFAVCAIYVRIKLAKFKKGAPRDYLLYSGLVAIAITAIQILLSYDASRYESSLVFFVIVSIAVAAIYIYANYEYFKKRSHLFIN